MSDQTSIAQVQSPPPAILPYVGPIPPQTPIVPHFNRVRIGDADIGTIVFENNGKVCQVPFFVNFDKVNVFFRKCPNDKFLNTENPECSCSSFIREFIDYGAINIKAGSHFYTANGSGTFYPVALFILLAVTLTIICAPFVYFFSYRMTRSELKEAADKGFFFEWHKQRLSSLICLTFICLGFVLLIIGVSGQNEIDVLGLVKTSAGPGVAFALFGFLLWRMIIARPTSKSRQSRR